MKTVFTTSIAVVAFALQTLTGCSNKSSDPQSEVNGTVLLDGRPLPQAELEFVPRTDTTLGVHHITTDEQGMYSLKGTASNIPLRPGEYVVLVRKIATGPNDPSKPGGGMGSVKNELPALYSDRSRSPLKVELKPGPQTLQPFELKQSNS